MRLLRTMILALAVLMTGTAVAQKGTKNFANMKVAKQGTTEYEAQRQAAIEALDTVIYIAGNQDLRKKVFGEKTTLVTDQLLKFVDDVCEKFKNDPVLMSAIAESFFTRYGNQIYGERRFDELKKMHPTFVDAYINEGRLWHALAYRPNEEGKIVRDSAMLAKARVQFDSAKVVMPKNPEPYLVWMRLQAKYDDADADAEIEKLKKAIPGYPADLEAARYYNTIAQGDYNYLLLNALNHYEKVNVATLDPTNLAQYSLLCNRANGKQYWERGLDLAKAGIKKDPNMITLYRFGLWNAGKAEKWDDAVEMGMQFFEKGDSIEKTTADYKWMATARLEREEYEDALQLLKREIEIPSITAKDKSDALGDMVDCYRRLGDLDEATRAFGQFESFRRANNLQMEAAHYQLLFNAYSDIVLDSAYAVSERQHAYEKYDSIVRLAIAASPNYTGMLSFNDMGRVLVYAQISSTGDNNEWLQHPKIEEVAKYCIEVNKAYQSTMNQFEIPVNDTYYLMFAYRYLLEFYVQTDRQEEAYRVSEIMLDMPMAIELTGLSESRVKDYTNYTSRAEQISSVFGKKYGKKKR